jgi:hypothetical protein
VLAAKQNGKPFGQSPFAASTAPALDAIATASPMANVLI